MLAMNPRSTGSLTPGEHDRHRAGRLLSGRQPRPAIDQKHVRRKAQDLRNRNAGLFRIGHAPSIIDCEIAADHPSELRKPLLQGRGALTRQRIAVRGEH
jgi:hypothetical protein